MMLIALLLASAPGAPMYEQSRAPEVAEKAAGDRGKMICKRFVKTGSLVDAYRECKPKWQWERERENVRQFSVSDSCRDRGNGGSLCR